MDDIVYNGPVTAGMTIFSDFHNKMEKKIYTVISNDVLFSLITIFG